MALCPAFESALASAIEYLMTGSLGRPYTLVETINWLAKEGVSPSHEIGKRFEVMCRDCEGFEGCFWNLLPQPKKLRDELEGFLGQGIFNYSGSIEQALLGKLPWSRIPLEFMFVWILGRERWKLGGTLTLNAEDMKRYVFVTFNQLGKPYIFIPVSGETDKEAEEQGMMFFEMLQKEEKFMNEFPDAPILVVTLSTENRGTYRRGVPAFVRLHHLPIFLATHA